MHRPTTRRTVLAGGCAAACTAALSACTTYRSGPAAAPAPAPAPAPDAGGGAAPALVRTADVPVGGGTVVADQDVVVVQPSPGEFRAFSATCTHQGCAVDEVSDGTIGCPCHGSRFAIADGSVVEGPAETPLPERGIEVSGEEIRLA